MKSHKTTLDKVKLVSGYAFFVAIVVISLVIRLSNPEMTETQLLINFPLVWVALGVVATMAVLLIGK